MPLIVLLLAVATWQINMAMECAMKCIHKKTLAVPVKQPVQQSPQCRDGSCPTPKPPSPQPAAPASR